jgi:hypothetical protein
VGGPDEDELDLAKFPVTAKRIEEQVQSFIGDSVTADPQYVAGGVVLLSFERPQLSAAGEDRRYMLLRHAIVINHVAPSIFGDGEDVLDLVKCPAFEIVCAFDCALGVGMNVLGVLRPLVPRRILEKEMARRA